MSESTYITSYEAVLDLLHSGKMKKAQHVEGLGWREASDKPPSEFHRKDGDDWRKKILHATLPDYVR